MVGLVLSAWPACGVALVGCFLSCLVVGGAVVSLAVYTFERRKIVNNPINKSVEVKTYEGTPKDSVRIYLPPPLAQRNHAHIYLAV